MKKPNARNTSRILCLIMLVIALSPCQFALAEEFSVRGGIKFGMTKDEVIHLETDNGTPRDKLKIDDEENKISYGNIEVANIPGSFGYYYFEDDKLFRITYTLRGHGDYISTLDTVSEDYENIDSYLTSTYGKDSENNQELFPIFEGTAQKK